MLKRLLDQVIDAIAAPESGEAVAGERAESIRKATAVLMIDVALADKVFDKTELDRILNLVEVHFGLGSSEAAELVEAAEEEAEMLVSLHEFTQLLHNNLSHDEKSSIIAMLWEIAYADGELDKYENSIILKISDLLHVSRGRVMRLKHQAAQATN